MDWLITFFQQHPIIPVFLTVGFGFWLGKFKIKSFALGSIAATLIVGVIIGQMKITVPDILKNTFFLLFLFSVGYSVGPQFFRAFKGSGLRMVCFGIVEALVCAGLVILASRIMGYEPGIAAGLFAGSQTVSASLGLLSDTVREMPMEESARASTLMLIPACYAVTYVFGTIGTAWFLAKAAPSMMGGIDKVKQDVALMEQHMDQSGKDSAPGVMPARRPVMFRAYKAESDLFDHPCTINDINRYYRQSGVRIMVERARIDGRIVTPTADMTVEKGDILVLGGRSDEMVALKNPPGPEAADAELLNFGAEKTPVTVAARHGDGMTIAQLRGKEYMERVMIASIRRNGLKIPVKNLTELHAGDVITLVGWPCDVAVAAEAIGYADPASDVTDMVFVGLGIAVGCIIGALSVKINGIPLSLGMSVGALLSGLILGWLRTRNPSYGHIPSSALWIFNNLGITMFIAVLGLSAGGALMHGLREAGIVIIAIGAVLTIVGLIINVFIARKVFRFSTPEVLGLVAGGRCCVAAIGAVQESLQSDVPNLAYTVTYAVGNVVLVFSALLVLFCS